MLDSLNPMLASLTFSNVFRLNITTWPNLAFLTVAIGIVIGFKFNLIVARQSKKTLSKIDIDKIAVLKVQL